MNPKVISLNEPYESIKQQPITLTNIFISLKNKEYEENNNTENNFFKKTRKAEDFESFFEYKNIFLNQNNISINFNDQTMNQFQTKDFMKPKMKNEKEEIKENETEEEIEVVIPKMMGRKRKDSPTKGKHNKYSNDNLYRKVKSNLLNILYEFINSKIKEEYKNIPKYNVKENILRKIEQKQIVNSNIAFNQNFLSKTLRKIFSVEISHKYKCNYNHNENLINYLIDEQNEKREKFASLFDLTFLDCINHFRGTKYFQELNGMMTYGEFKEKYKDDNDYIKSMDYIVNNYETIIMNKKSRKSKQEREEN